MAGRPLVSIITPTWQRHDALLGRCIPSVLAQDYAHIEQIVVSDGPDPELVMRAGEVMDAPGGDRVTFAYLTDHNPAVRWGVRARRRGIELARGEYIAWLDDDNAYRPEHISRLVAILEASPRAAWGYSRIEMHSPNGDYLVGSDPPVYGGIDTSAMISRRAAYTAATWRDEGQPTIDWDLAERWIAAGLTWAMDPQVTADYYFAGIDPRLVAGVTVHPLGDVMAEGEPFSFTAAGHSKDHKALMELLSALFGGEDHALTASQFTGHRHNGPLPKHAAKKTAKSDDDGA